MADCPSCPGFVACLMHAADTGWHLQGMPTRSCLQLSPECPLQATPCITHFNKSAVSGAPLHAKWPDLHVPPLHLSRSPLNQCGPNFPGDKTNPEGLWIKELPLDVGGQGVLADLTSVPGESDQQKILGLMAHVLLVGSWTASAVSRGLTYNLSCSPSPLLSWCCLSTFAGQAFWGSPLSFHTLGCLFPPKGPSLWILATCLLIPGALFFFLRAAPLLRGEAQRRLGITFGLLIWRFAFVCFASFNSRKVSSFKLILFWVHRG